VQLRSQQEPGRDVAFAEHADEVAEAEQVAADVQAVLQAGTPAREVAVLFRINAQSEAFEEAMAARAVPYVVRGAARFFQRPEVKQAVALLRGNARSGEDDEAGDLVAATRAVLAGMGWTEQAPTGRGSVRDRWESLQALVTLADELVAQDPTAGLAQLVADLEERAGQASGGLAPSRRTAEAGDAIAGRVAGGSTSGSVSGSGTDPRK
jgi:DNA helicase-2/ATP-dependent DNA helicase PcrA